MRANLTLGTKLLAATIAGALVSGTITGGAGAEPVGSNEDRERAGSILRDRSVEELARVARQSVVVVSHTGRSGERQGMGSGFVVSADGLIATSLHVIGEGRPVTVELADKRSFDVVEIHAWDRKLDLAVVRVKAEDLKPLALGDSDTLRQGARVVAMGNPLGLAHSIVQGVVSARRDFEGVEMIQLAIPIEEGNSGGPMLDLRGKVHGLLTMKSVLSPNLGFATPVNALKTLLEKPNPVPMDRWVKIAGIDSKRWESVMGARWSQRGGRIQVQGRGSGFGGRALCLSRDEAPDAAYELAVTVKLENESGAAGLAFASDGGDKHYGFYPSAGQLRLTRFEGPSVFSWTILADVPTQHYRPGDWNRLHVRVKPGRIECYVNGELVIESADEHLRGKKLGLAKFRDTNAEFRNFAVGKNLPLEEDNAAPETEKAVAEYLEQSTDGAGFDGGLWDRLAAAGSESRVLLLKEARELEERAEQIRHAARRLHSEAVARELREILKADEADIDLLHAALLISKLDDPELEIAPYRRLVEEMAREIEEEFPKDADDETRLKRVIRSMFVENGFHGSRTDYYNRSNSYINDVLDDREGIPITLAVLFIELANRVGIKGVAGASLPKHFMVKFTPEEGEAKWVDVFDSGAILSRDEVQQRVENASPGFPHSVLDRTASKKEIVVRMLRNLLGIAREGESATSSLRYLDVIVAIEPDNVIERLNRAVVRLRAGEREGAKDDLKIVLDAQPAGVDLERLSELYRSLQ